MAQCALQRDVLQSKLTEIQKIVDEFNFNDFSNLQQWVDDLDERIKAILIQRLQDLIHAWTQEFIRFGQNDGTPAPPGANAPKMINYKTILEVKIQNQTIVLDPPISEARAFWYKKLHEQLEVICGLSRVEAYRYEKFKQSSSEAQAGKDKTYQTLILKMSQDVLNHAYMTLEKQITGAEEYVKTWKSYQTLWDIDASHIFNILDENIEKWQQILNEIRQGRKTFDNSETEKAFGALIIYYGGVQAKVNNKYDQWHRDILNKFGSTLLENLMSFNQKVQKARRKLETLSIDVSDDVTMFVTEIQEMKHSHKAWGEEFEKYKSGYKLLISQRY